jgi:hypothetical protein
MECLVKRGGGVEMKYKVGIYVNLTAMHYVEVEADNEDAAADMVAEDPKMFVYDWAAVYDDLDVTEMSVEDVFEVKEGNRN